MRIKLAIFNQFNTTFARKAASQGAPQNIACNSIVLVAIYTPFIKCDVDVHIIVYYDVDVDGQKMSSDGHIKF